MLTTIRVTATERAAAGLHEDHLATALRAMREDGVLVLEDAVDPSHVAALRQRMLADIPAVRARSDAPFNWNTGNLQQSPPRELGLLFRDVLCNDQAVAITSALMPAPRNCYYSGNTALPSTQRQPVHGDGGQLWHACSDHPPYAVVVNLLLQDTDAGNGATEIWPGSHHLPGVIACGGDILVPQTALEARRAVRPPLQPTLRCGSLVLRDLRLWHAGMPNHSQVPRLMIAMIHNAGWMPVWQRPQLPALARELLAHSQLAQEAEWLDEAIDHTRLDQAYAFAGT